MSSEFGRAFAAHLAAMVQLDAADEAGSRAADRLVRWFCADLATLAARPANATFEVADGLVVAGVPVTLPNAIAAPIASFAACLESVGTSGVSMRGEPDRDAVLHFFRRVRTATPDMDRNALQRWFDVNRCDAFRLLPLRAEPTEEESARPAPETVKAYGRLWYMVARARTAGTLARAPAEVRSALRTMVERVEASPRDAIGLAAAAAEDDDPATRKAVHGALLAIALGQRVGLVRGHLVELAVTTMIAAGMDASARATVLAGQVPTRDGAVLAAPLRRLVALQQVGRDAPRHLFTRILTIALAYDEGVHQAGTRGRADEVLTQMLSEAGRTYDRALLDAFSDMMGRWPLGTTVLLESGEVGVVYKLGVRTLVRIVVDRRGTLLPHGPLVEAASTGSRRILGSIDPGPLGINPADALFG